MAMATVDSSICEAARSLSASVETLSQPMLTWLRFFCNKVGILLEEEKRLDLVPLESLAKTIDGLLVVVNAENKLLATQV